MKVKISEQELQNVIMECAKKVLAENMDEISMNMKAGAYAKAMDRMNDPNTPPALKAKYKDQATRFKGAAIEDYNTQYGFGGGKGQPEHRVDDTDVVYEPSDQSASVTTHTFDNHDRHNGTTYSDDGLATPDHKTAGVPQGVLNMQPGMRSRIARGEKAIQDLMAKNRARKNELEEKRTVRISESKLNSIIAETVKNVLKGLK